jgi:hypothetical protein
LSSRIKVSGALTRASSIISEEKAELDLTQPEDDLFAGGAVALLRNSGGVPTIAGYLDFGIHGAVQQ